jgi:hypothetical protein
MPMTAEEISKKLDEMEKDLASVTKRAEEAEAALLVAKLDDEDREAYDALPEADQASFVQGDDAARSELLEKARKAIAKRDELPESVRKQMEDVSKQLEDVRKQLTESQAKTAAAETVAKKAQDEREMVELTKRAEEEFAGLPGTPQEKAIVLKAMNKMTPEEKASCEKMMAAGNACLAGQMKPVGKGGSGVADGGAWGTIEKKAKALVAADVTKKLTVAKATETVIEQEPALYEAYLAESK